MDLSPKARISRQRGSVAKCGGAATFEIVYKARRRIFSLSPKKMRLILCLLLSIAASVVTSIRQAECFDRTGPAFQQTAMCCNNELILKGGFGDRFKFGTMDTRLVRKAGNDGSVSCDTYCNGNWPVTGADTDGIMSRIAGRKDYRCSHGVLPNGKRIDCGLVRDNIGYVRGKDITCYCHLTNRCMTDHRMGYEVFHQCCTSNFVRDRWTQTYPTDTFLW